MSPEQPYISIVMPVYNAAPYLRRSMESLVYQTLENIEIICVDKASTDNSLMILNEYSDMFPDKVKVFSIPYSDTPAAGRNYGISIAKADYIAFIDADDMYEYDAMQILYDATQSGEYDIWWYPFFEDTKESIKVENKLRTPLEKGNLIQHANISFWNKLIRRKTLLQFGEIPNDTIFDDMAYIITLISKVKKQNYIDKPLYHHIERGDSESRSSQSPRMIHVISAAESVVNNVNPVYYNDAVYRVVKWIIYSIKNRWLFFDEYVDWLKKYTEVILENPYLKKDKAAYSLIQRYIVLSDEKIPKRVFVNGFDPTLTESRISMLKYSVFHLESEIVVLNETNCNLEETPIVLQARKENNYSLLGSYFAAKKIYEQGGVFIGPHICVDNPLNALRRNQAFVSQIDPETYSDELFGGIAGSVFWKKIIDTYQYDFYDDPSYPMGKRIRNIIIANYAFVDVDQRNDDGLYIAGAYATCMLPCVSAPKDLYHFTSHIYNDNRLDSEYATVRANTYIYSSFAQFSGDRYSNGEIQRLRNQIHEIKNADSWKLVQFLKNKKASRWGKILFPIYKKFTKILIKYFV